MTFRQSADWNAKNKANKNFKKNQGNYIYNLGAVEILTKTGNPEAIKEKMDVSVRKWDILAWQNAS